MKILIVEDHQGISFAMQTLFELEGYRATCVDRGEQALDALKTEQEKYDLILLDLNTNGISAEEFMHRFKTEYPTDSEHRPSVAIMSGSSSIEERAEKLGVDLVIRKPFDQVELMKRVESLRQKRHVLH